MPITERPVTIVRGNCADCGEPIEADDDYVRDYDIYWHEDCLREDEDLYNLLGEIGI